MLCFITLNIFLVLIVKCASVDIPSYFPKCDLNDLDLDNCLLDAAEELKPYMQKGIENLKLPGLGPLFVSNFIAVQQTPLLNYSGNFSDCIITGLGDYNFQEFQYDPKTKTFVGSVQFDAIVLNCDYKLKGRVLTFPLEGNGTMEVGLYETNTRFEVKGNIRKRKGVAYYNPISTKIKGTIEDGSYQFNGLFGGDEQLSRTTNRLLNLNSKLITHEATLILEVLAEKGVFGMMKAFTSTIPFYELFSQSRTLENPTQKNGVL